jgi:hypothetical protein
MTQPHTAPSGELSPHQRVELDTLRVPTFHSHLRKESVDLAYLLGAWVGCTEIGGKPDNRVSFATQDPRQVELIEQRMISVVGRAPNLQEVEIHGVAYKRLVLHSEEIAHHFQRITAFNSRVPWEHLGTADEMIHFVRGMFDHGGWVFTGSSAGIGINKKDGEYLLRDVGRLLARIGILPIISFHEAVSLRLKEQTEWRTFAEKIELSIPERREIVKTLAQRHSSRNHFIVKDYEMVKHAYETLGWAPSKIAHATGVPANSVRDWVIRGQKPPAVKRKEIIDSYSATMPNPEVITAVYRALGASSGLAVECGKRVTVEKVNALARQLDNDSAMLYGNDERIAHELLGSWAKAETLCAP